MAFSRNLWVRLRFWHFSEALALSSEYSMYSCLSQRSVDPAYPGPVGLSNRTGAVNPPQVDRLPPL